MRTPASQRALLVKISENVCYTELVYQRVNKKLSVDWSHSETEAWVQAILRDPDSLVEQRGKNYYVANQRRKSQLTVNSHNYRLITVNRLSK
ncbi:DUF3781 domain-containing protein [Levilactobacillus fujinensis]|uniref:DUF3781 domain-containing protein n=1 Tax=Levilactobacillus fujinensis TaxID=2486024 RepID=A0ABW1TG02_9LACO|nr:DUF3781 domain-containing protein [Levilactobacillus fujinensis]